jgi:hypothetical protein
MWVKYKYILLYRKFEKDFIYGLQEAAR